MKERKFKEYFSIETNIDPKTGKTKRQAKYSGDYFRMDRSEKKRYLHFVLPLTLLFIALWIGYMLVNTPGCSCLYVFPIHACAVFPLVYLLMGLVRFIRCPEKMTIVEKESGIGRMVHSLIGMLCIEILAFIGDWVMIFIQNVFSKEWMGLAIIAATLPLCYKMLHFLRPVYKALQTQGKEEDH